VTNKQPNKQTEITYIRGKKQRNAERNKENDGRRKKKKTESERR
jgi:hypothetical protein